jgi:hypothetical protein
MYKTCGSKLSIIFAIGSRMGFIISGLLLL